MSATEIYHILLFAWPNQTAAREVAKDVRYSSAMRSFAVAGQAIVERDDQGRVRVRQAHKRGTGALIGALAGGAAGIVLGPFGIAGLGAAGALGGAVIGGRSGQIIPNNELRSLGAELPAGSSGLVILVRGSDVTGLTAALQHSSPQVIDLTQMANSPPEEAS